jgi:hypothetical protein
MASFDSGSFDTGSFDIGSFFLSGDGAALTLPEWPLFFRTTIKTPEVFFITDFVDHVGFHTTMKDELSARVNLK